MTYFPQTPNHPMVGQRWQRHYGPRLMSGIIDLVEVSHSGEVLRVHLNREDVMTNHWVGFTWLKVNWQRVAK